MSTNEEKRRRSGRGRIPKKRDGDDIVDGAELEEILRNSSESSPSLIEDRQEREASEFEEIEDEAIIEEEDDVVSESGDHTSEDEAGNADDDISDIVPDEEMDGLVLSAGRRRGHGVRQIPDFEIPKRKIRNKPDTRPNQPVRNRGLVEDKSKAVIASFGNHPQDTEPLWKGIKRWVVDITIPSRPSQGNGIGGLNYSFFQSERTREIDATVGWDWLYKDASHSIFKDLYSFETLSYAEASQYMPEPYEHSVVWGPLNHQTLLSNKPGDRRCLSDLCTPVQNGSSTQSVSQSTSAPGHEGWLLTLGNAIQSLDWAPQMGSFQHLAITTRANNYVFHYETRNSSEDTQALHFASIQIWTFPTSRMSESAMKMDMSTPPWCSQVLCFDVDLIRQVQWCPTFRGPREVVGEANAPRLLAALGSDGIVRVFEVECGELSSATETEYKKARNVLLLQLPETKCSCIAWISQSLLIAGCANGHVAMWDLDESLHEHINDPSSHHRPLLYYPFHSTYILKITVCLPSRPHLILTISMDGFTRLTSILAPESEWNTSPRSRTGFSAMAWHEQSQCAIATDDTLAIRAFGVRLFHHPIVASRTDADVMCLATSPVHASVLVGCTDGNVSILNPLAKIFLDKDPRAGWMQCWFKHDWRRGQMVDDGRVNGSADMEDIGEEIRLDYPNGLSRIVKGFRLEKRTDLARHRPEGTGPVTATIYEEQQAIRAVAWNPNIHVGGWAAAGTGSGFVFVEDLCWDP